MPTLLIPAALAVVVLLGVVSRGRKINLARAAPPDTDLWVEVDARLTAARLAKLAPLAKALASSGLRDRLRERLRTGFGDRSLGTDWDADVQPWLGSQYALGVSGLSRAVEGRSGTPDVLVVATVRDRAKAEKSLANYASRLASEWGHEVEEETTASGVLVHVLRSRRGGPDGALCYAVTPRVLYLGNRVESIGAAAARMRQGGSSLRSAAWYADMRSRSPKEPLVSCYLSAELMRSAGAEALKEGFRGSVDSAGAHDAAAAGVWLDVMEDRLALSHYISTSAPFAERYAQYIKQAGSADTWGRGFSAVPKGALVAASFEGVQWLASWLSEGPLSNGWHGLVRELRAQSGVDLERELVDWVEGISVVLLPARRSPWPVEIICELRGRRQTDVADSVGRIESGLRQVRPFARFADYEAEGLHGRTISGLVPGHDICLASAGDSLLIATSRGAMAQAQQARQSASARITSERGWRQARGVTGHHRQSVGALYAQVGRVAEALTERASAGRVRPESRYVHVLSALGTGLPWVASSATIEPNGVLVSNSIALDYAVLCGCIARCLGEGENEHRDVRGGTSRGSPMSSAAATQRCIQMQCVGTGSTAAGMDGSTGGSGWGRMAGAATRRRASGMRQRWSERRRLTGQRS